MVLKENLLPIWQSNSSEVMIRKISWATLHMPIMYAGNYSKFYSVESSLLKLQSWVLFVYVAYQVCEIDSCYSNSCETIGSTGNLNS